MRKPHPYGTAHAPQRSRGMSDEAFAAKWDAWRVERDVRMVHLREQHRYNEAHEALRIAIWSQRFLIEQNRDWLMDHGLDAPVLCVECVQNLSAFITRRRPSMGLVGTIRVSTHQHAVLLVLWMTRLIDDEARRQRRSGRRSCRDVQNVIESSM